MATYILPEAEEIEIIVNDKSKEKLVFLPTRFNIFSSAYLLLTDLQEGVNEIKFRSPQSRKCLSFSIGEVELFRLQDIPIEGLLRLEYFTENGEGEYLIGTNVVMEIFTIFPASSLITFQIQATGDDKKIYIYREDEEIDGQELILSSKKFQEVGLLTYQSGKNSFIFVADVCTERTIEGEKRCIAAQVKNLKVQLQELNL